MVKYNFQKEINETFAEYLKIANALPTNRQKDLNVLALLRQNAPISCFLETKKQTKNISHFTGKFLLRACDLTIVFVALSSVNYSNQMLPSKL